MRVSSPQWGTALVCLSLLAPASAANAATIVVPAGGDLQTAINAAQAGDVISLAPGASYVGNFILPNKGDLADVITIRSGAPDAALPGAKVRITPAYAAQLPKIFSPNSMAALRMAAGANHYRLQFLEFQANYKGYGDIIELGQGDATQTTLAQVPYALVVDRVYVHGDPIMGQKRGIALHSRDTTIVNSYIADCKAVGQEAQAIGGFNGPGNYDIENNYLEGSTQSFLMGGADPTIPNLVTSNITFRGNYLSKPLAWRGPIIATPANVAATIVAAGGSLAAGTYTYRVAARVAAGQTTTANSAASAEISTTVAVAGAGVTLSWTPVVGASDYVVYGRTAGAENTYWTTTSPYFTDTGAAGKSGTAPSATQWYVKNLFELKNAQDVLVEGNVMENLWVAAQPGYAVVFTPRNQSGTAPWAVVQRVTFQHNLVRHTAGVFNILGIDNLQPSQRANHIVVRDNVLDDVNTSWGSGSRPVQIGDGPDTVTIDHNTVISNDSSIVWLYGTPSTSTIYTNNMSAHNSYGIMGSGSSYGTTSINTYMPGAIVAANVLAGGSASRYPAGNYFPTVAAWQGTFVNYAAGDYRLAPTSPYKSAGTDGLDLGAAVDIVSGYAAVALSGDATIGPGSNRVQITTSALPDAVLNTPYGQAIGCTGGLAPCAWQIVASLLPDGITFDTIAGAIVGTPSAVQTGNVTVTAYDPTWPSNTATATLTLTVDPPPFTLTLPASATAQVGSAFQLTGNVSGTVGSASWSILSGALPDGVGLDALTGAIAGTPTHWGATTAVVQVADSFSPTRVTSQALTIVVAPSPLAIAASTAPAVYQQPYSATLAATGGTGSATWSLIGGTLPTGLLLTADGTIAGTPSTIGTATVTVQAVDANWPTNVATAPVTLVVNTPTFVVALPPAPGGQVGVAYQSGAAIVSGAVGTVTWTGAVPAGLVLNAANGSLSGTPAGFGSFMVTLTAHDSYDPSRVASVVETIAIAPAAVAIATTTMPDGNVHASYAAALAATGGTGLTTWTFVSGALPDGLTLAANGVVSGTASTVGSYTFTVQAADAGWVGNVASRSLTISVHAQEIVLYAGDATKIAGTWSLVSDATAAGGTRIWNPDKGAAKIATPLANPVNYFEMTFQADAGVAYHFWLRGKADNNYWGNDSVMIQFANSVDATGAPLYRIGTTGGSDVNLEDCSGCGESGWGWQDNGWGVNVFGPDIYFAQSGWQTLRVQVKEDGFSIDQVVLSAGQYLHASPGALKNDTTILPR